MNPWEFLKMSSCISKSCSDWHTLMNNICDLGVKTIAHYLLILNKCLFEAALNWKAFIVICPLHEALWAILKCGAVILGATPWGSECLGSQAKLLYILSKIQMSATVPLYHRVKEFALKLLVHPLCLSNCIAHGRPRSPCISMKLDRLRVSLTSSCTVSVLKVYPALHGKISSTCLTF